MAYHGMLQVPQIQRILPHRYPMLLVDRVTDVVPGERLTALKAVTCNEPWYRGAPGGAGGEGCAYPPVLLVESWCQAAVLLAVGDERSPDALRSATVPIFGSIGSVRFRGRALPGDTLEHHVRLVRALSDTFIFEGETLVGPSTVLEVSRIVLAQRPVGLLRPDATTATPGGTS
jgi:3-hydroxyacyl-[acyl-carrier-protein] dehydratase